MAELPSYKVEGLWQKFVEHEGRSYAVWRVLHQDNTGFVCAFFGPASYSAASKFCEAINADPAWNKPD